MMNCGRRSDADRTKTRSIRLCARGAKTPLPVEGPRDVQDGACHRQLGSGQLEPKSSSGGRSLSMHSSLLLALVVLTPLCAADAATAVACASPFAGDLKVEACTAFCTEKQASSHCQSALHSSQTGALHSSLSG